MSVVRYLSSALLAVILVAVICLSLAAGLAVVWSRGWEEHELTEGSEQQNWAWIDGRPIHYWVDGPEGSPVVALIHGRQVEGLESWREVARSLSRSGLRVIAIDLVGCGHSARDPEADLSISGQAEVAGKVLNELRITDATVVGHGWGASVALSLAHAQPQLVGRVGLVDPLVYGSGQPVWHALAQVPFLGRAAAWAFEAGGPLWASAMRNGFGRPGGLTSEYLDAARETSRIRGTLETWAAIGAQPPSTDVRDSLPNISQPALIVRGSQDPWVSQRDVERLARELPAAQAVTVEDAGFYSPIEQSDDVARLLLDFALGRAIGGD